MPPKSKDHSSPSTVSNILENTAVAKHSRPIDSRQHFIHSKMLMQSLSFLSPQEILGAARSSRQFAIQGFEAIEQYQLFKRFESEYKKGGQAAQFLDLVVGSFHNLALILNSQREQEVYAWGDNDYESLGLGDNKRRNTPSRLNLGFLKPGYRIHSLVAGTFHNLALTQNAQGEQELYAWGDNHYGQLGLGDNKNRNTPSRLNLGFLKPGFRIHSLVAAGYHNLTLTQNAQGKQELYVWGHNHEGQLGLRGNKPRNTPSRLNLGFLKPGFRIHSLIAGTSHNLTLTQNAQGEQEIYVWGGNHYGELGLGDSGEDKCRNTPTKLDLSFLKPGFRIFRLITRGRQNFALTHNSEGALSFYAWGCNDSRQLGLEITSFHLLEIFFKEKGFQNSVLAKLLENPPTSTLSQFSTFCSRHPRLTVISAAGISLSLYALWRQRPQPLTEIITKIAKRLLPR